MCRVVSRTIIDQAPGLYTFELELLPIGPAIGAGDCTTVLAGAEAWDSGNIAATFPVNAEYHISPDDPTASPGFMVAAVWSRNTFDALGGDDHIDVSGDFTEVATTRDGFTGAWSTMGAVGYHALIEGDAGTCDVTWNSNWDEGSRALAVTFPTAATAPLQVGKQMGSGGSVVLDDPPTAGNLLVCVRFAEGGGANPDAGLDPAWTVIASAILPIGFGGYGCSISARCVEADEDATINTGDSPSSHWGFVMELELT